MGAFREFFEGLFNPIAEAIEKVTVGIDEAILNPLKDKIDDFLEPVKSIRDKIGELPGAIEKITGLPEDVGNALKNISTWLDEQKDELLKLPKRFELYVTDRKYMNSYNFMSNCACVDTLKDVYLALPEDLQSDPMFKTLYLKREEELRAEGKVTVADLALNVIGKGIVEGVNVVTQNAYKNLGPLFKTLQTTKPEDIDIEDVLEKAAKSGEFGLNAVVGFMLGHFLSPVLSTATAPVWEGMGQVAWKGMPVRLLPPDKVLTLLHRHPTSERDWKGELQKAGYSEDVINDLMLAYKYYPGPSELTSWLAREVYEEDAITKYGLLDEAEKIDRSAFYRAGLDDEQIDNFWKAHWMHPSFTQLTEMLHRGILHPTDREPSNWTNNDAVRTWEEDMEKELYEWYRLVEIPPHWRDKLTAMSYNVPTRVDVRRWYDLRTITEDRLRELYHNMGYHGKDLEDYVLWTKIYVLSGDLKDRYRKGYITKEDVTTELKAAGMDPSRADEWTETIAKASGDERITKERDLTKAEIYKGVKKGVINREQGMSWLQRLGYDAAEAKFILDINVEHISGSPETYWEFESLISEFEGAMGKKRKDVPDVLKELEKEYREHPEDTELELEYRQAMKDHYKEE